MRSAEAKGCDAGQVLAETVRAHELRSARSVSEVLAWRLQRRLVNVPEAAAGIGDQEETAMGVRDKSVLPWLPTGPIGDAAPGTLPVYLSDAAALIDARVTDLVAAAAAERPAWMSMLGQAPADDGAREQWLRHVAVVVAYRDQYRVTTDDPRQVLGPYPQAGRSGHKPYWHAAGAVLEARRLTGLDHPEPGRPAPGPTQVQMARDIYLGLPEDERTAIAAAVAANAGVLWLGDRDEPDEDAAAQFAYADYLVAELVTRKHTSPLPVQHVRSRGTEQEPLEATFARRRRPGNVASPDPGPVQANVDRRQQVQQQFAQQREVSQRPAGPMPGR
jgi:hypothetical protein